MCKGKFISLIVVIYMIAFGCHVAAADERLRKIEIAPGAAVRLNIHASATRDCKPAGLPEVKLIDPPSAGMVRVRRALLTTSQVEGCPNLRVPAQVVFYVSRPDSTGTDHLSYEVRSVTGESRVFEFDIILRPQQGA